MKVAHYSSKFYTDIDKKNIIPEYWSKILNNLYTGTLGEKLKE